jgi:hypothetical protein
MTEPAPGGFDQWVESQSVALNSKRLTLRHRSFIAAVLRDMGIWNVVLTEMQ